MQLARRRRSKPAAWSFEIWVATLLPLLRTWLHLKSTRWPTANVLKGTFGILLRINRSRRISIDIHEKYDDALSHTKKLFNALKSSLMPFGGTYATVFQNSLPFNFSKYIMADSSSKFTLIYSNLNASKIIYYWDGKKLLGQFFFVPGCSKITVGIGLCTTGDIMSMTCFSDIA